MGYKIMKKFFLGIFTIFLLLMLSLILFISLTPYNLQQTISMVKSPRLAKIEWQKHKAVVNRKSYPLVYKATIELEVDGQPITLSQNITCERIITYKSPSSEQSTTVGRTFAMSEVLPTGEVVIGSAPSACNMFKHGPKNVDGKFPIYIKKYDLSENYLPWIAIADKQVIPDLVFVYASKAAYKSPAARIKFKSVDVSWAGANVEPDPYDRFHWFLAPNGVTGGERVDYYGFGLREAVKTPYVQGLIDKYHDEENGKVLNFHTIGDGWKWGHHNTVFPEFSGRKSLQDQQYGGNILPSSYENYTPLIFTNDVDFINGNSYKVKQSSYYAGMVVLNHMYKGIKSETPYTKHNRFVNTNHKPIVVELLSGNFYKKYGVRVNRDESYTLPYDPVPKTLYRYSVSDYIKSYRDF